MEPGRQPAPPTAACHPNPVMQPDPATQPNAITQPDPVTLPERKALLQQRPCVLWFTGLSGAGKTALSNWLDRQLHAAGLLTYVLDGDNLRRGLNRDLGFSPAHRQENVRRLAHVASLLYDAGIITLVACISPFQAERDFARSLLPPGRFIEIFVDTPLSLCEQRDAKGLYRRARAGEITNFTGIDSPYQRPAHPEIAIATAGRTVAECGNALLTCLHRRNLLTWPAPD